MLADKIQKNIDKYNSNKKTSQCPNCKKLFGDKNAMQEHKNDEHDNTQSYGPPYSMANLSGEKKK
tara:strand:- start:354 stop:548 length:195 start_codon:yes stop_codon:yes gene_type:complete